MHIDCEILRIMDMQVLVNWMVYKLVLVAGSQRNVCFQRSWLMKRGWNHLEWFPLFGVERAPSCKKFVPVTPQDLGDNWLTSFVWKTVIKLACDGSTIDRWLLNYSRIDRFISVVVAEACCGSCLACPLLALEEWLATLGTTRIFESQSKVVFRMLKKFLITYFSIYPLRSLPSLYRK